MGAERDSGRHQGGRISRISNGLSADGWASGRVVMAGLSVLVLFAALALVQRSLDRRTHRVLNPPLVAAAVLTAGLPG
jgi:hypothetical protein